MDKSTQDQEIEVNAEERDKTEDMSDIDNDEEELARVPSSEDKTCNSHKFEMNLLNLLDELEKLSLLACLEKAGKEVNNYLHQIKAMRGIVKPALKEE